MKTFIKYDYYIQVLFLIAGINATLVEFQEWNILTFYFVVGIPQLISFLIRLFLKSKKSGRYIVYGIMIIPVWISLLLAVVCKGEEYVVNLAGPLMIYALFYSPILALVYIYDCYSQYETLKLTTDENPQQSHPDLR